MELSIKFDSPLTEFMPNKMKNVHIQTLNRAATTLTKAADKMPEDKQQSLRDILL